MCPFCHRQAGPILVKQVIAGGAASAALYVCPARRRGAMALRALRKKVTDRCQLSPAPCVSYLAHIRHHHGRERRTAQRH